MNFLFRTPLLDIDPKNEAEIDENWDQILKAISFSSISLYNEIARLRYRNLQPKLKKKVYKYILRGRYRATPFGYLAGVGIGDFSDHPKYELDLSLASPLVDKVITKKHNKALPAESELLYLAEGGFKKWGRIYFLSYLVKQERWGMVNLPFNKLMKLLTQKVTQSYGICYADFQQWFENPAEDFVKGIWDKILDLGILNSRQRVIEHKESSSSRVDVVFGNRLSLPTSIAQEIENFGKNAGHLFTKAETPYLDSLKAWFIDKFDDRFLPLTLLLKQIEFINSEFISTQDLKRQEETIDLTVDYWSSPSIDFQTHLPSKCLKEDIFDLQLVFKIGSENRILIENMVCNRPFVYIGRFNRHTDFYSEEKKIKQEIYQDSGVIYAELCLFETEAIESICRTRQLFEKYITPFPDSDPNAIQLEEIEIGLRENEFILVHKTEGKRLVPVVTHPLNGKEISHPLMRLLWELDHQNPYKFFGFNYLSNQERPYIPQLNWGRIILQPRKWSILLSNFTTKESFAKWAIINLLPNPIQLGYLDRELLLNWKEEIDLDILWYELHKWNRVTLSDPIWLGSNTYNSKNKKPIYPQFVSRISKPKFEAKSLPFINSVWESPTDCLYILIRIPEDDTLEFLDYLFCEKLLSTLNREQICWYYLVYPSITHMQIRVRFLKVNARQRSALLTLIALKSEESLFKFEIRPYFPEMKKYGEQDYKLSEQLFYAESSLLTKDCGKSNQKELLRDSGDKLNLVLNLWMMIITKQNLVKHCFDYTKKRVKSLHSKELKILKNTMLGNELTENKLIEHQAWMKSYSETISKHSFLVKEGSSLYLLSNHIHMQVNRFFPTERKNMENMVYLLLYKRLGRMIYGKT